VRRHWGGMAGEEDGAQLRDRPGARPGRGHAMSPATSGAPILASRSARS
jgi:hypothetical protein